MGGEEMKCKELKNFIIGWIRHLFHKDVFMITFDDSGNDKALFDYFKEWMPREQGE